MSDKPDIFYSEGKLWGVAGGQLEFVSLTTQAKQRPDGAWYRVAIIRFTDHDVQAYPNDELIDGCYYELEFPIAD